MNCIYFSEIDSDGDEIPDDDDDESRKYYGYRVWYSLEIQVQPSPPERIMTVECACHVSINYSIITITSTILFQCNFSQTFGHDRFLY
jgi:hypothetical protein